MSKSNSEVIKGFCNGKQYRGANVYASGDRLYSYGTHFTLAIRRNDDGREWYLLNGDKYSISTSQHQAKTYRVFADMPRVSFTAIHAAGINEERCRLIDFTPDTSDYTWAGYPDFDGFRSNVPIGAEYHERKDCAGNVTMKLWHRIGGVLLEQGGKYYLCAMDEGSYFVSWLPGPCDTVDAAFDMLKPEAAREAISRGLDVKRQGEWFFIPVTDKPCREGDWIKSGVLPRESGTNEHYVTRVFFGDDTAIYVKGIVRHRNRWGGRGDHRPVKLGDGVYVAVKNTELGSWSASGKVD